MSRRLTLRAVAPAKHHRGRAGRRRAACAARPDGRHRANCAAHSPHLAGPDALSSCAQGAAGSAEGEDLGMIEAEYGEWLARGQAHQQAARPIDAMLCYRQALKSNRNAVQAQFQLGEVLRDLGRREEALAAFRMALSWQPQHLPSLLAVADLLRRTAPAEAVTYFQRAAALDPRNTAAREGLALSLLASGDSSAFSQLAALVGAEDSPFREWDELSRMLAAAPPSSEKLELLRAIESRPDFPPSALLLAIAIESMVASTPRDMDRVLALFDIAERRAATIADPESLRRLALTAAAIGLSCLSSTWAQRYARVCAMHSPPVPLLWPRRTSGSELRVAYLVPRGGRSVLGGAMIDIDAYLRHVATAHARDKFAPAILFVGDAAPDNSDAAHLKDIPVGTLGVAPGPAMARAVAEADYDALIDLAGMAEVTGPFLAARPARTSWGYPTLPGAHGAPPLA